MESLLKSWRNCLKTNDFTEKIKRWIGGDKSSAELLLEWLDKPENFKKIFEIVN